MITDVRDVAQTAAGAAMAVPGVARMAPGRWGEAVTYHRGGRSAGVQVRDGALSVHVVVDAVPIEEVAERVRRAVAEALAGAGHVLRVDVVVEDIEISVLP